MGSSAGRSERRAAATAARTWPRRSDDRARSRPDRAAWVRPSASDAGERSWTWLAVHKRSAGGAAD
eukprot:10381873-Alexandrium_andersonii.AAC.1